MYPTRDECLEASMKDEAVFQQNDLIDILYREPTGDYRYAPHVPRISAQSGESLYGILERQLSPNAWLFRPVSEDAKQFLESNPLPGTLIIGNGN
jgi:hypothetical protein